MADFSYLSDTDDSAVEELIHQTKDLCVLEQVSRINCSGFTHSDLPGDLESRFSKLKSFPVRSSKSSSRSYFGHNTSDGFKPSSVKKSLNTKHASFKRFVECPDGKDLNLKDEKRVSEGNSKSGSESLCDSDEGLDDDKLEESFKGKTKSGVESFSDSDEGFDEKDVNLKAFSAERESFKDMSKRQNFAVKKSFRAKTKSGSRSFSGFSDAKGVDYLPVSSGENDIFSASKRRNVKWVGSSRANSGSASPSPPKRNGCFWWSPKKSSSGKKNVDFLKEQEKILKKAMKEQERINKEMEKFAKLAKQASARIILSGVDDVLSDSDGR